MTERQNECKRCALVTGSSSGIGEAIVRDLARLDWKLVVTGRSGADIKRVADACASLSPSHERPLEVAADLEREQDLRNLFAAAIDHFNGRLDLLVNNAGLSSAVSLNDTQACWENFTRTIQVNLNSACLLTLLAVDPLRETAQKYCADKPTSVVNISSIAALQPLEDFAYCVSKSGLCMLSNCFAGQLGPLVRVNCINPGPVQTKIIERSGLNVEHFQLVAQQMSPLQRVGRAQEVSDAVVYLADPDRASFITGAQLNIDGGITCGKKF